ncbi:MAG: hypothetical protein U0793_06610 [Gemmataceae bacterium]
MLRASTLFLAIPALLVAPTIVRGGTLPADALPIPNRVAAADVVIVGQVLHYEEKMVSAPTFPGSTTKADYKIAVINVRDPLIAPKGIKTVRIGFIPPPPMVFVSPPPFQPALAQEGIFLLKKHGAADFYVAPLMLNFIDKKNPNFDKDVALIQRCAKIKADPKTSLKAKSADDRFLAAAVLLAGYRTRTGPSDKTEPIDAEQSKLILEALAGADWTPSTDFTKLSPMMALHRLPLTAKDGWTPPKDAKAYPDYARQWLRDHAEKYRIERFVPAEK